MTNKGIKKFNKKHNIDWVDASSIATNIFDLNEITIEDKSHRDYLYR